MIKVNKFKSIFNIINPKYKHLIPVFRLQTTIAKSYFDILYKKDKNQIRYNKVTKYIFKG